MFRKIILVLATIFGLAFIGATLLNADLVSRSRRSLTSGLLRNPSSYETARRHIVVVLPDLQDSFFQGLVDGILESAQSADSAVQVFRYSLTNPSVADIHFETAVRAKVDGIILYAAGNESVAERAAVAEANGVVFIPVGTDPPAGAPHFVGSGSYPHGFEGGSIIGSHLGSSARIGVIVPAGAARDPREDPLYAGLAAGIQAFPGARIVAASRAGPGRLSGEEAVASMLRENAGINALLCSSAMETEGAAQVVVDQNLVGTILIIGADETSEVLRFIDKGVVAASIVRDSRRIGKEAISVFTRLKDGLPANPLVESGFSVVGPGSLP